MRHTHVAVLKDIGFGGLAIRTFGANAQTKGIEVAIVIQKICLSNLLRELSLYFGAISAILISILWIDRPLAQLLANFRTGHAVFSNSTLTLPIIEAFGYIGVIVGLVYLIFGRKLPKWTEAAMLAGIALLVSQEITHDLLKPLFGRVVPSLYLKTGQYGFQIFRFGAAFGSFPSGHSVQAAAILSVAWIYYPQWRLAYGAMLGSLAVALMLGQWHYLGDVIAGYMVGSIAGKAAIMAWRSRVGSSGRSYPE